MLVLLYGISTPCIAVIGLPENTLRYGAALGYSQVDVQEPDGSNPNSESMTPVTLIITDWLSFGGRYWVELINGRTAFQATETEVGQNLNYSALRMSIQHHIDISNRVKPWFGAGLVISRASFTTRHTKTDDGFLNEKLDDRVSHSAEFIINAAFDIKIEKNWFAGIKAEQTFNPNPGVNLFGGGIFLLYLHP